MKTVLIIFTLLFTGCLFGQNSPTESFEVIRLEDTEWKTNIHCFTSADIQEYQLSVFSDSVVWNWGNFISFGQGTFETSYSAPCGSECFTHVSGTYENKGVNRIEIYVERISRNAFCNSKSEKPEKTYGIYHVEASSGGLTLKKEKSE